MAQVIGIVSKLVGQVNARLGNQVRELKLGDEVFQGEILVTGNGAIIEIDVPQAPPILLAGGRELLLTGDVTLSGRTEMAEASIDAVAVDELLAALEGDGDLLETLEATAAGGAGGDQGSSFVRLGRIGFTLPIPEVAASNLPEQAQFVAPGEPLVQALSITTRRMRLTMR